MENGQLYEGMSQEEREIATEATKTFFNHKKVVRDDAYDRYPALDKFFLRTAYS